MESLPGTVVGIRAKDGVVLASEKRLTYDGFVLSRNAKKLHLVTDRIGVGFAGLHGDANYVARLLKLEAQNYELEVGRSIRVRSLAKVLSIILYSFKLYPLMTEVVVGGVDDRGPSLFVLDAVGSLIEEKYAAIGSGAQVALGVIEPSYRDDMALAEARELAIKSLRTAIERDVLSGDGIDLLVIGGEGARFEEYLIRR
ncbi:MAG: proteasome subunit beta [Desulfurococcaceae archaeon]